VGEHRRIRVRAEPAHHLAERRQRLVHAARRQFFRAPAHERAGLLLSRLACHRIDDLSC